MGKKLDVMNLLEREILVGVGKFIHGGADGCPLCGSDQTDADGGLDQDGWTAWRLMRCNDCDGEWQELFEMSGLAFRTGKNGEWERMGMLQVQYHSIKQGAGLETWRGMDYQTVLTPSELKTGPLIFPYEKAK